MLRSLFARLRRLLPAILCLLPLLLTLACFTRSCFVLDDLYYAGPDSVAAPIRSRALYHLVSTEGNLRLVIVQVTHDPNRPYHGGHVSPSLYPGDAAGLYWTTSREPYWISGEINWGVCRTGPWASPPPAIVVLTIRPPFYHAIEKSMHYPDEFTTTTWGIPYWFATLISLVPLTVYVARVLLRRPHRVAAAGLCPRCAYDLRATPGRCPECGLALSPARE